MHTNDRIRWYSKWRTVRQSRQATMFNVNTILPPTKWNRRQKKTATLNECEGKCAFLPFVFWSSKHSSLIAKHQTHCEHNKWNHIFSAWCLCVCVCALFQWPDKLYFQFESFCFSFCLPFMLRFFAFHSISFGSFDFLLIFQSSVVVRLIIIVKRISKWFITVWPVPCSYAYNNQRVAPPKTQMN